MQSMLSTKTKSEYSGFKKIDPVELPPLLRYYYHTYILCLILFCKKMVDDILSDAESDIKLPIDIKHFEKYFTGFKFVYEPLPEIKNIYGYCKQDGDTVYILYNPNLNEAQIKFTIAHELFHFYQDNDLDMREIFNDLLRLCHSNEYAENVARSLIEEATDIAAFIFLMPPEYPDKNSQKIINTLQNLIEHHTNCLRESLNSI